MNVDVTENITDTELSRANIISLHGAMTFLAIKAGIQKASYNKFLKDLEAWTDESLVAAEDFIISLYQNEWRELYTIRYGVHGNTEELWENYKLFNITGQAEQVEFGKAAAKFRAKWKTKPERVKRKPYEHGGKDT